MSTTFLSCRNLALGIAAWCVLGCSDISPRTVPVVDADAGHDDGEGFMDCDNVEIDGTTVLVHEEDVTARFTMGEPFDTNVMLFGGEAVQFDNAVSNLGIIGLDQSDAVMLATKYADFHLCSSPGGKEAQAFIVQFDLVPASCEVYATLVEALAHFATNSRAGGDRVSLHFEGALLELESVTFDETGQDATDQVAGLNFHLVTRVEELTGESLLQFGMQ